MAQSSAPDRVIFVAKNIISSPVIKRNVTIEIILPRGLTLHAQSHVQVMIF
jgi:hypothetical protein